MTEECLFCNKKKQKIIFTSELLFVVRDSYPVTKLHTLIIPHRHVSNFFDLNDKELNALYRSADVFLSPSTGCNAPSTIRESTVNNTPTIAFDNGEASEAIVNKVNGFLIPKFDKKKFAEAIFDTIFDKNLNNDKEWSNFLKLRYSSKTEAEMIINKALSDFKK